MSRNVQWSGLQRHRPDHVSALFGLVFVVVGLIVVLSPAGVAALDVGFMFAVLALTVGLAVVVSVLRRNTPQEGRTEPSAPAVPASVLLTPDAVREEDREWFGLDVPLSQVEREIEAALAAEDGNSPPTAD